MARDHGFHPARIVRVIQETADTRTYVLDAELPYRAGQFVTVKAGGALRSYSMSSAPETDGELMTTVKRVPGGQVSTWIHANWAPGDVIEVTAPTGVFCLRDVTTPVVAFCGGSGVTPILSLAKSALAATHRKVRMLTANRDAASVIFKDTLETLAEQFPDRCEIRHHLDTDSGLVTAAAIREFTGPDTHADFYICGPAPFMNVAEQTLLGMGVDPERVFIERFAPTDGALPGPRPQVEGATVTIVIDGKEKTVPQHAAETLLESARRAGFTPPFSCEAGNCATCLARLTEGAARMRANNALDEDEVADGWVLTCQGEPTTAHVTVVYED